MFRAAAAIARRTSEPTDAAPRCISARVTSTSPVSPSNRFAYESSARSPRRRTSLTMRATRRSNARSRLGPLSSSAATACLSPLSRIRITPLPLNYPISRLPDSHDDLVQRIFDDALRSRALQQGNQVANRSLVDNRVHRDPVGVAERGDGRAL